MMWRYKVLAVGAVTAFCNLGVAEGAELILATNGKVIELCSVLESKLPMSLKKMRRYAKLEKEIQISGAEFCAAYGARCTKHTMKFLGLKLGMLRVETNAGQVKTLAINCSACW